MNRRLAESLDGSIRTFRGTPLPNGTLGHFPARLFQISFPLLPRLPEKSRESPERNDPSGSVSHPGSWNLSPRVVDFSEENQSRRDRLAITLRNGDGRRNIGNTGNTLVL